MFASAMRDLLARTGEVARALDSVVGALAPLRQQLEGVEQDLRMMSAAVGREEDLRRSGLVKGCLEAIDDLDRALGAAPDASSPWVSGVEMVRHSLLSLVTSAGVERIQVKAGDAFDPAMHFASGLDGEPPSEAVQSSSAAPGPIVLEEMRPGYRVGGMILRPAQVRVGWPAQSASGSETHGDG